MKVTSNTTRERTWDSDMLNRITKVIEDLDTEFYEVEEVLFSIQKSTDLSMKKSTLIKKVIEFLVMLKYEENIDG